MKKMLAMCLMLAGGVAHAAPLAQGNNLLSGTTVAAEPKLAASVVVDKVKPFTFTIDGGTFSGSVQNRVVLAIDGTYDFSWRIFGISFSGRTPFDIQEFRIGKFGTSMIGVNGNYRTDGSGEVAPTSAFVFAPPQQNYVDFLFSDGLDAGEDSYFMFLDTDATSYAENAMYDFGRNGSEQISGLYTTFGPGLVEAAVPEPVSWAMMIAGFGLAGTALRRRRPERSAQAT